MKTKMNIIEKFIIDEVAYNLNRTEIPEEENLLKTGIIDSMAIIKLVTFIEETFKMRISEEDLVPENFQDLKSITGYVEKHAIT